MTEREGEADPICRETGGETLSAAPAKPMAHVLELSQAIPGWTRGEDAAAVVQASFDLRDNAVIVEIGVFLGSCTVLLAGARQLRGSGVVHCVDPFDCSGDAFSVPYYRDILASVGGGTLRQCFEANIAQAGLTDRVRVHQGRAAEIAVNWSEPIDLLLFDGDQSPSGARAAYEAWVPFLKPGGTIVLRNTLPRVYAEGHDGHRRLAVEEIVSGRYVDIRQVNDTTIARKAPSMDAPAPANHRIEPSAARQKIHLYAQCWNDEFMLPHFFRHYDSLVDRYVIFDDGSTDRSLEILSNHPRVDLRRFVRSEPDSFVLSEQALSDQCWKESRGVADWVIVTDIDEHLYHPAMPEYLAACAEAGVTLVPALGLQMICDEPPRPGQSLREAAPRGAPFTEMMKTSIFRPDAIEAINFQIGRHLADPVGSIWVPDRDEVLLLHYKYLGLQRTYARHRELLARLGATDVDSHWGFQYSWSLDELATHWKLFAVNAVDPCEVTHEGYPLPRWWLPGMSTVPVRSPVVGTSTSDERRAPEGASSSNDPAPALSAR